MTLEHRPTVHVPESSVYLERPVPLISPWLYLVNGDKGEHISEAFGVAVILEKVVFIIDPGSGLHHDRLLSNLGQLNISNKKVYILATHLHHDHMAGAQKLKDGRLAEDILVPDQHITVPIAGDRYASDLYDARFPGAETYPMPSDTTIKYGSDTLEIISTPGHSPDHACYVFTVKGIRVAIIGDIFGGDSPKIGSDMDQRVQSIRKMLLLKPEPDFFLDAHGAGKLEPWNNFKVMAKKVGRPQHPGFKSLGRVI